MLVRVEHDNTGDSLESPDGTNEVVKFRKTRALIKKLGEIALGDRWEGQLKIVGNEILIGKDTGVLSHIEKSESRVIKIDLQP